MEKMTNPARREVNVSVKLMIHASLYELCLKSLYDEYVIRAPKPVEREKKDWVTAAYQTFRFSNCSH